MEICELNFVIDENKNESCNFFIKKENSFIHVFITHEKKVILIESEEINNYSKINFVELFELAFNEKFLNYIKNSNENLFFNDENTKKIFQEFKKNILNANEV